VIDSLKEQKDKVKERVIVKVEKLKTLPPDSTIQLFHESLQAYGEIKSERPALKEDSSVVCSLNNLRGANIITAKYEGAQEENQILKRMVIVDSEIIAGKDSIIDQSSIILNKTKEAYDSRLEELNQQLKKETRIKRTALYGGAILVGVLGGLLLIK
jgi:hypothetical protein